MGKETQTQKFGFATGKVTCAHSGGCSCFWGRPQDRSEPSQRFGDDPGQTQPCTSPEHSAAHAGTFPLFLSKFLTELCADVQSWLARCHGGCTAINLDFMGREKPLEEPSFEPFSL